MSSKNPVGRPPSPHKARGLELLRSGMYRSEVARTLGVPPWVVWYWVKSEGLTVARNPRKRGCGRNVGVRLLRPRAHLVPILDLLLQKERVQVIVASLGVSRQAVYCARARWI